MLLKDLQADNSRKMAKINKTLREQFGFTLASAIDTSKLNKLYTKIADDLYNLKLDLSGMKDKEYVQKLLVSEGLKIMLENKRQEMSVLREAHLAGPGARRYEAALSAAAADVTHACEIGDDYEEAIKDAMKDYRSSELRFPDEMFEFDLRDMTSHCTLDSQIAQYESDTMDYAFEDKQPIKETKKLVDTFIGNGTNRSAKIFKDYDWNEFVVKFYLDGKYQSEADYHTTDLTDAEDTADGWVNTLEFSDKEPVTEDAGHSILDIISQEELEDLRSYVSGEKDFMGFYDSPAFEKLYQYYAFDTGAMPYGIAKGREGDPDQWILNQVEQDYASEVLGVEEAMGDPKGRAEALRWRSDVEQNKKGSVEDYYANRRTTAAQPTPTPTKRKWFENKTTGNRKENMKEGYVKQLRKLLEAEVEQAESLIAARGFSQELQDMVEKLGRLVNEDLPAVSEQMRDAYGADVATGFENTVGETLSSVMDALKGSKQDIDNSVTAIADGQAPSSPSDMGDTDFGDEEFDLEGDADLELPDMDAEGDLDMDLELDEPEGTDDELLGRAKKESVDRKAALKKQLVEMQQKLARIKAKRSK